MKKYRISEELGNIDEAFLEEVLEYRRNSMNIKKIAALAACAALVIGVGAFALRPQAELPVEPPVNKQSETVTNSPDKNDPIETSVIEVERSYNERIADGEDVSIETYIGIPYTIHDDFISQYIGTYTYTLRDVHVSDKLPEGITKSDLTSHIGAVENYTDDGNVEHYKADENSRLTIASCIDDEGVFDGPGNGYKWMFVTIDITNESDEAVMRNLGGLRLDGGELRQAYHLVDGVSEPWEGVFGYSYWEELCYISNHYFDDVYYEYAGFDNMREQSPGLYEQIIEKYGSEEEYLKEKFYYNVYFEAGETKTLVIGFPINNYFVYGELLLEINPTGTPDSDLTMYIPLK